MTRSKFRVWAQAGGVTCGPGTSPLRSRGCRTIFFGEGEVKFLICRDGTSCAPRKQHPDMYEAPFDCNSCFSNIKLSCGFPFLIFFFLV